MARKCDGRHIKAARVQPHELRLNNPATARSAAFEQTPCIVNRSHRTQTRREIEMVRIAKTAIIATILGLTATSAFAETWWERNHPRRDQVNDRLENQDRRINREYREGELNYWQARRLHQEDHTIRAEERAMAGFDHGHITRSEERALNGQENVVSGQIGR
jgi:hypothetical protein